MRSCNDDYVPTQPVNTFTSSSRDENADEPWSPTMRMKHTGRPQPAFTSELFNRVPVMYPDNSPFTRSTCEPNELEKKNFSNENRACISQYPDANIQFREVKVVIPWLHLEETDARFVPDARLEAIDAKLEANYAEFEKMLNGSEDDIIRPDFDDDTKMILEYVERNKFFGMTIAEAVDYLKSCHHCGNTNIPFGNEYCNERCQDYSVDFSYRCFRGADCKACENYYRHNCFIKYYYEEEVEEEDIVYDDSGEMTPRGRIIKIDKKDNVNWTDDEDNNEEFSLSDRNNESTLWDIQDQERENYEEMILEMAEEAEAEEDEW
jgi:hypothetical protein